MSDTQAAPAQAPTPDDECANCGQTYERHGRVDGEGAVCPDRTGMGFELAAAALPGGEGRQPSEDFPDHTFDPPPDYELVESLKYAIEKIHVPEDKARLRWLARHISALLVASRDTRDAGAVEPPVAWILRDKNGYRHRLPFNFKVQAEYEASEMNRSHPALAPFTVIPLVPAPPGRAGTDNTHKEKA